MKASFRSRIKSNLLVVFCAAASAIAPAAIQGGDKVNKNPVIPGYYADPAIMHSEKTGLYYLYPTSDGYENWGGKDFRVFSSPDLKNWTAHGTILELGKDVTWADRNAWAPCILERKQKDGSYKYYFYFVAAGKIGVAVADDPLGPFKDSGRPMIDERPAGVKGGQQIDPDVFVDPKTNDVYLYWGNGYFAGVKLGEDLTTYDKSAVVVFPMDRTFREGGHVLFRNGTYYFLWSEDDTRSENYKVRYGTAPTPLGPLAIPPNNIVIQKDPSQGIYATGHNQTIRIPGTDEWRIVYHRFAWPDAVKKGWSAGYHREVCIDPMTFDSEGRIVEVKPQL